jgi:hypothetical protein
MIEDKRNELHEKAYNLAFHYYIRSGQVPPLVAAIASVTSSKAAFETAMRKYSADQPRVPAGNGRESGRWAGGNGSGDTSSQKDPGAVPVKLNDGSTVLNPNTGNPVLMPKGVSLSDNAKTGETLNSLPSIFSGDVASPQKEQAMVNLLGTNGLMDYQRLYDGGKFNATYTDFGNYNYGVVAAADGYTLPQAMLSAGLHNVYVGNHDVNLPYLVDHSENTFIPMGYSDYTSGRITSFH